MKILVVGGNKGLGLEIVRELGVRKHEVLPVSRESYALPLDLRWEEEQIMKTVTLASNILGGMDALVISSGMGIMLKPTASTDILRDLFQVNCIGPVACYKAALKPLLRSKGKMMIVSSTSSRKPGAGSLAYYGASKGAINSWAMNESRRVAKKGISIFVLQPGWFESPMTDEIAECEKEKSKKYIPMGRFGTPEEIAKLGVDLLESSNWVTSGSIYECSGGA